VICERCGHDNPSGHRFCGQCGAPLPAACPSCGSLARPQERFCGQCGSPIAPRGPAPDPAPNAPGVLAPADAERRQLTVVFCDLVGSTELSHTLDAEDLRAALRAYQEACAGVIERFGGHVAQHLGDGLLVYFGYPAALGDDAVRGVRAGLEIARAVARLETATSRARGVALSVRVGIDTGLVVVGQVGTRLRREDLAIGEAPNIASRMQAMAEPGTVVISAATHRLVRHAVACRDLGQRAVKGLPAPARVYQALADAKAGGVTASRALIGRERQLSLLLDRGEAAADGRGQVALVLGEAGIGKSRLIASLRERLEQSGFSCLEGRCSPIHQHSPMYVIADLLANAVRVGPGESPDERRARLEAWLRALDVPLAEASPFLAPLIGASSTPPPGPAPTPQRQKQRTLEALVAAVHAVAARQPLLVIVEDLHWVDPSSLEVLSVLVDQVATSSICAVFTGRSEFAPTWPARSHLIQLRIDRLARRDAEALTRSVFGDAAIAPPVVREILERGDGNPLFLEELSQAVLESAGSGAPGHRAAIPASLQDSLLARLDRLGTAKAVAQTGAVLGREFSFDLLQRVTDADGDCLARDLQALVDAELLYQRGLPPAAHYTFKHALIQEAAYELLLRSSRQQHHARVAEVLERDFAAMCETSPETVAHHWAEAGRTARAVHRWQQAGDLAVRRSGMAESIAHYDRALALLAGLPEGEQRDKQELVLRNALGSVYLGARGFAASETVATFARARELCATLGDVPEAFPALWAQAAYLLSAGNVRSAVSTAERAVELARKSGDSGLLLQAHHAFWLPALNAGRLHDTVAHCRAGLALYDPARHEAVRLAFGGHDARACAHSFEALALWYTGESAGSVAAAERSLALASELRHPTSLVIAHLFAANLFTLRREAAAALRQADTCIALCSEFGLPQWRAYARQYHGAALAMSGDRAGLEEIKSAGAALQAVGTVVRPSGYTYLALACFWLGEHAVGVTAVADGLAAVAASGERLYESVLLRLRGEFLLQQSGSAADALASFRAASGAAREIGARVLALQATTSAARLLGNTGEREDARALLSEALDGFAEAPVADVLEARDLLSALT
jgi:predicted ATPase/class 3 adenylate cyclase